MASLATGATRWSYLIEYLATAVADRAEAFPPLLHLGVAQSRPPVISRTTRSGSALRNDPSCSAVK